MAVENDSQLVLSAGSSGLFDSLRDLHTQSLICIVDNYVCYYAAGDGHTAKAKRYDLDYFLQHLSKLNNRELELLEVSDWTYQSTFDFVNFRMSAGESPATVSRRLATVKHLGRTLAERVPGFINPAREVKSPKLAQSKPKGLNTEELELLREAAKPQKITYGALRDQLIVELLLATGLRADEVRLLTVGQIDTSVEWLKNVKTKGKKLRNVYIDSRVRPLVENFLLLRQEQFIGSIPEVSSLNQKRLSMFPLFLSVRGGKIQEPMSFAMAPKTLWRIISNMGKRAQVLSKNRVQNFHPHLLRHTFAHGLLDSSQDIRLVAQALGHSDVRTTMRYTERTEEEIQRAIEEKRDYEDANSE